MSSVSPKNVIERLTVRLLFFSLMDCKRSIHPSPYATVVPFLLGRRYHLTCTSVCASRKYFFHIRLMLFFKILFQALLFLFAIITQVVIGIFWLSVSSLNQVSLCDYTSRDHTLALTYVIFQLMFVSSLAVKSWHCRDNYR